MIDTVQTKPSKIPTWKYAEIERKVVDLYIEQDIHKLPKRTKNFIRRRKEFSVKFLERIQWREII